MVVMGYLAVTRFNTPPTTSRINHWLTAGDNQLDRGRYQSARMLFRAVLAFDPDNQQAYKGYKKATFYGYPKKINSIPVLVRRYETMKDLWPDDIHVRLFEAELENRKGNNDIAISLYHGILFDHESYYKAMYQLAVLQKERGDLVGAQETITHLVFDPDKAPEFLYHSADLLWKMGIYNKALDLSIRVLISESNNTYYGIRVARLYMAEGSLSKVDEILSEIIDEPALWVYRKSLNEKKRWCFPDTPDSCLDKESDKIKYINLLASAIDNIRHGKGLHEFKILCMDIEVVSVLFVKDIQNFMLLDGGEFCS